MAIPLLLTTAVLSAAPANAANSKGTHHGPIHGNGYVIVDPTQAVKDGNSVFYPTGPVSDDTLVVIPNADGSLPGGMTMASLQAAVSQIQAAAANVGSDAAVPLHSDGSLGAAPQTKVPATAADGTYYSWAATSAGWSGSYEGGAVIGTSWTAEALYNFNTQDGFNEAASGMGIGHYRGYDGSTFGTWTTWYDVGTADNGDAGSWVPWGYVAAPEQFEAECDTFGACGGNFWDF